MANIIDIEGIGSKYKKRLNDIGIKTTEDLLKYGSDSNGINEISKKTGIPYKLILEWVNISDLFKMCIRDRIL